MQKPSRKLQLNRETIRNIMDVDLENVHAAGTVTCSWEGWCPFPIPLTKKYDESCCTCPPPSVLC